MAEPIENRRRACRLKTGLFLALCLRSRGLEGTNHNGNVSLSWTLDQGKAVWFAQRFSDPRPPLVTKALNSKCDIVAYFGERKEREIVSLRVLIISVTNINIFRPIIPRRRT